MTSRARRSIPSVDSLRATVPCIVLDVPHQWTGWTKRTLIAADDILIVAGPDLANLRNAKNLLDLLRAARPNDRRPSYCLNQVGVPKRPEIKPDDFAKALDDEPVAVIPFEPQIFGTAANNGQMIAELSSSHRTAETFRQLAQAADGSHGDEEDQIGSAEPVHREADEAVGVIDGSELSSVFGKRYNTAIDGRGPAAVAPHLRAAIGTAARRAAATRPRRARRRPLAGIMEGGRAPIPSPGSARRCSRRRRPASARRRRQRALAPARPDRHRFAAFRGLLRDQGHDLRGADRGHRPRPARQARRRFRARGNPRHRQRDHRDQGDRDVDLRAGRAARRHLQRRARLWPARAAAGARRHRRHHGERLRHDLHRSQGQDPEDRHPVPRQPAAPQHLPAHRQPDRPPGRRILADLRCAPARTARAST